MYKIFKFSVLVIAFATLISCNSEASQQQQEYVLKDKNSEQVNSETSTNEGDKIRWHYYKDPKNGMVKHRSPVPANWVISENADAEIQIKGPDGLIVNKTQTENFTYSTDPFMQQTMRQMGKQVSPVVPLETIIRQHIKPQAEAQGYFFIKSYPLPGYVKLLERFAAGMPQTGSHIQFNAVGTEWSDNNGKKSFIAVVQTINTQNNNIIWSLQTTELEAPSASFDKEREAYVYALANTEVNPQWQQMKNGELINNINRNNAFWAAKTRESTQAHQQRMAAIESWGNTSRSIANTYSEISDISHAGYLKRSDIISGGHSKTINMIGERAVIGNHDTGEHYNVDAGSKFYWVNNRGEYIGTNNSLYDPRIDNTINDAEWTKFNVEQ